MPTPLGAKTPPATACGSSKISWAAAGAVNSACDADVDAIIEHHPAAPSARATVSIAVSIVSGSASGPPYAGGQAHAHQAGGEQRVDGRRRQPPRQLGLVGVGRDELAHRLAAATRSDMAGPLEVHPETLQSAAECPSRREE